MYESVTSSHLTQSFIQPDINPLPALLLLPLSLQPPPPPDRNHAGRTENGGRGLNNGHPSGQKTPPHLSGSFRSGQNLSSATASSPPRLSLYLSRRRSLLVSSHAIFFSLLPAPRLSINGGALGSLTQAARLREPLAHVGMHSTRMQEEREGSTYYTDSTHTKKIFKKSSGTYAVSTPLNWLLHGGEISHTHTECLSTCTLWRASRLTLVACVYKAPERQIKRNNGDRRDMAGGGGITAAARRSSAPLPPLAILSTRAPWFFHPVLGLLGPAWTKEAAAEGLNGGAASPTEHPVNVNNATKSLKRSPGSTS